MLKRKQQRRRQPKREQKSQPVLERKSRKQRIASNILSSIRSIILLALIVIVALTFYVFKVIKDMEIGVVDITKEKNRQREKKDPMEIEAIVEEIADEQDEVKKYSR